MNNLTMKCKSVGNPDHGQYAPVSVPQVIEGTSLGEIREKALKYIAEWDLGGGNWPNCIVKQDGKAIGYMSYNGRFWADKKGNWTPETKEILI